MRADRYMKTRRICYSPCGVCQKPLEIGSEWYQAKAPTAKVRHLCRACFERATQTPAGELAVAEPTQESLL